VIRVAGALFRALGTALGVALCGRLPLAERRRYLTEIFRLTQQLDDARDERDRARAAVRRYEDRWLDGLQSVQRVTLRVTDNSIPHKDL